MITLLNVLAINTVDARPERPYIVRAIIERYYYFCGVILFRFGGRSSRASLQCADEH